MQEIPLHCCLVAGKSGKGSSKDDGAVENAISRHLMSCGMIKKKDGKEEEEEKGVRLFRMEGGLGLEISRRGRMTVSIIFNFVLAISTHLSLGLSMAPSWPRQTHC